MLFDLNDVDAVGVVRNFRALAKAEGKTFGLTSGCFDLIHFQHFGFFIRCRRACDYLVVGVDTDETVRAEKGCSRPVIPDFQRAIMVDALRPVSFTFIMSGVEDFGRAAEILKPDVIFKNDQFKGREQDIVGREHAERTMILEDQVYHNSTTEIIHHASTRHG